MLERQVPNSWGMGLACMSRSRLAKWLVMSSMDFWQMGQV
jgi:hypothetical protein